MWILLYGFYRIYACRKNLEKLDYTNLFSPNEIISKYFEDKYVKSQIDIKKNRWNKNYFLEEIKHNDLLSEKHRKRCKYLNYVEVLLILASTVPGCVSISAFASLVCFPVGIMSSAVGIKIVQSLQELKVTSQLLIKRRRSMIK